MDKAGRRPDARTRLRTETTAERLPGGDVITELNASPPRDERRQCTGHRAPENVERSSEAGSPSRPCTTSSGTTKAASCDAALLEQSYKGERTRDRSYQSRKTQERRENVLFPVTSCLATFDFLVSCPFSLFCFLTALRLGVALGSAFVLQLLDGRAGATTQALGLFGRPRRRRCRRSGRTRCRPVRSGRFQPHRHDGGPASARRV